MGCPPVRGDNPRALASNLSYVQVDKHGIKTPKIYVDLAHQVIFHAKVGKCCLPTILQKCNIINFDASPAHHEFRMFCLMGNFSH